jgi:hypothetical protein
VFLSEADELDTVGSEPFDVLKRFPHPLPREPVERANQNQIELPLSRVQEHAPKFDPIRLSPAFVVDVLDCDFPALSTCKPA